MNMKKTTLYIIPLLLFFATTTKAQQRLQLNLTKGATYQQVTGNNASIVQEIMGQSIEITVNVNSVMSFTVLEASKNDYDMQVTFESMKLSMGSLQGQMDFDSENPKENDAFSQVMAGVIGESFNIKMSKTGKVLEISGVEAMWESAFSDQNVPAAEQAQIMTQLNQTYGGDAIKGNIEMVTAIFPEEKVNKGDQWTNEVNINSGMKGIAANTYTYEGTEDSQHLISGKGSITTDAENSTINTNGLELTMDLNGTMDTNISLDITTGWIVQATINQKIDGNAVMAGNAQMPNGLTIPMKINNDMTITN